MKRVFVYILLFLIACPLPAWSAVKYVRPADDCEYNGNGNSWGCAESANAEGSYKGFPVDEWNRLSFTAIPKGSTVYVAGSDNTYNYFIYQNSDATGEEERTHIKKATPTEHGTDAGWEASFGTAQGLLGPISCNAGDGRTSGYLTVDGVYRTNETSGYGFKYVNYSGGSLFSTAGGVGSGYCHYVTIRYAEVQGYDGYVPDGCMDANPDTCGGVAITLTGAKHMKVEFTYLHDTFAQLQIASTEDIELYHNRLVRNDSTAINHSNAIGSPGPSKRLAIKWNWFEDIQGTGVISLLGGADFEDVVVDSNVFIQKNTNPENGPGTGHGVFTTNYFVNSINNLDFVGNTMIGFQYDLHSWIWLRGGCSGTCNVKNNLWYCQAGASCGDGTVSVPNGTILHFDDSESESAPIWSDSGSTITCPDGTGVVPSCASEAYCNDTLARIYSMGGIFLSSPTGTFSVGDNCTTSTGKDFVIKHISVPENVHRSNNYFYGNPGNAGETGSQYPEDDENPFVDYDNEDFAVANNGNSALNNGENLSSPFNVDRAGNQRPASGPWSIGAYEYQAPSTAPITGNSFSGVSAQ